MLKKVFLSIGAAAKSEQPTLTMDEKVTYCSVPEMISTEIESGSGLGAIMNSYVKKGDLVPSDIVIDTMLKAIEEAPTSFVEINGFPRTVAQMDAFYDRLADADEIRLITTADIRLGDGRLGTAV